MLLVSVTTREICPEWGAEASMGGNPISYYSETLRKENTRYNMENSGKREAFSFSAKIHYEWIGVRFWSDIYLNGTGTQKTQSGVSGQQSSEQTDVAFSKIQNWRGEIQLRKFYYGHREIFTFNFGLLYRKAVTDLIGQPSEYTAASVLNRYIISGIGVEPLLTYFGKFELSLPLDLSVGLKLPEGGIFSKDGGLGVILFAAGLRLQLEPRGVFITTQGSINYYDTSYKAVGANYAFDQTEITLKVMVGYYFRKPLYNE